MCSNVKLTAADGVIGPCMVGAESSRILSNCREVSLGRLLRNRAELTFQLSDEMIPSWLGLAR
jgi:hypothetical protein